MMKANLRKTLDVYKTLIIKEDGLPLQEFVKYLQEDVINGCYPNKLTEALDKRRLPKSLKKS